MPGRYVRMVADMKPTWEECYGVHTKNLQYSDDADMAGD